jgi:aldose 1-epimerase
MITKKLFGKLLNGADIFQFKLENNSGTSISIINYGAIVTNIFFRDKNGILSDLVLGYDSLEKYINDKFYLGIIAGRYANRIAGGRFRLNDKECQLSKNDGENHLHGGYLGLHKRYWRAVPFETGSATSIKLIYESPDGEEGYPGNVKISVVYSLTSDNEIEIKYSAVTDRPTIINLTHHSYFNLSGNCSNSVLDHELSLFADYFTPINKDLITTGVISPVKNTPMDFRSPSLIGLHINDNYDQLKPAKGYDHNWVLNDYNGKVRKAAVVHNQVSGIKLEMSTDQPGLQFYSGNSLDGSALGKNNTPLNYRTGLCLEAQLFPDSPNKPLFPSPVLNPGEEYNQTTIYKLSLH